MFRRRQTQTHRTPHPDPARELELRRILDLRDSIDRRADLIDQYRKEIGKLHKAARETGYEVRANQYLTEAKVLDERIAVIEDAIEKTGGQIAEIQAAMSPDDLAFLS
jgi:predicted  nucleic acid-binding Zn-ribbon protein